jgi:hypothetical protein
LLLHPDDLKRITDEVLRLQKILKIRIKMTTGYFDSDPLALCYPLTMKELFINSKGQISFCCQLSDYEDAQNGTDVIANLEDVNLYEAHQRMADAVAKYMKDKIQSLADGKFSKLDYYPCWYCLKYFRKVDWLTKFPDSPWSLNIVESKFRGCEKDVTTVQRNISANQEGSKGTDLNKRTFQTTQEVLEAILDKDECVLIHPETKLSYALNRTGLKIWHLLKEGRSIEEMVEKLQEEFEVNLDQAKRDVVNLIQELLSLKLILASNKDRVEGQIGSA